MAVLPEGAFGALLHYGVPFATTLERTYETPEAQQLVKIPPGLWTCKSRYFLRGGYDSYEVTGVPGHFALLFHKGNLEDDSDGCILVGTSFGRLYQKPAVLNSHDGFTEFMRRTGGADEFLLRVRQV